MQALKITPNPRYLSKLRLIFTIAGFFAAIFGLLFGLLIGIDEGAEVSLIVFICFLAADFLWWAPAMLLAGSYYRSLNYEIQDDEVIVHAGILTKSVKHVPYRTVTNIKIKRGIFDRYLFNIGTLNIQTAGMSGSTGAEESLVGLADVHEVYDHVVGKLRQFRGGMSPTAAETDDNAAFTGGGTLDKILTEVRAIRQKMEK